MRHGPRDGRAQGALRHPGFKALLSVAALHLARANEGAEPPEKCAEAPEFATVADLPSVDGKLSGHWLLLPADCDSVLSDDAKKRLEPRSVGIASGALCSACPDASAARRRAWVRACRQSCCRPVSS